MKKTITFYDMLNDDALEGFSYSARQKLFEIYNKEEYDNLEYDPVAIRCDWNEECPDDFKRSYRHLEDIVNAEDDDDLLYIANMYTCAYMLSNGCLLYMAF